MSTNQKIRGEHLRKISFLFLAVCLLNIGWSWPFHKKSKESTESGVRSTETKAEDAVRSTTDGKTPAVSTPQADPQAEVKGPPRELAADVTVIASRLPSAKENINDMASNVTFKDSKELGYTQPMTFQDAVRDTEGAVFYDEVGNGVDSTFSLRGFTSSSATVFLVDGVRVNEVDSNAVNFPLIPMRDVQSIQIERGSSSAVYGSNAFAGVVNITTGQASSKPVHLFGGLEWTSFHGLRFNQGVSGTIQDKVTPLGGKFTYYFNGERDNTQGYRNHSEFRMTSFDIKTAYELPDDQGRFYVNIKHMVDGDHTPGEITSQQFHAGTLRPSNKPYDGRKLFNTVISLGADKRFWDDHILTSIMYSERLNKRNIYTTYGTFTPWAYPQFDPYTAFLNMKSRDRDLTWQLKYDDQWKWLGNESLLGMEVRKSRQTSAERYAYLGNIQEALAPTTDHTAQYDNAAIFWRETLKICDKIIPYVGMRHDFNWLHTQDALTPTNNVSQRLDKSTVSTGVTVQPFKWIDLFGNYSQGFRVPTMDETVPYAGANQVNLNPETSNSYEAGTRLRYKDMVAYKFSYFLIDVNDEIQWDNVKSQYYNIAQTRRYGIEQRVDVMPVQEVKLYGSYTWTTAYVHNSNGATTNIAEGRSLGQVPANRFTLGGIATPLKRWGTPYDGFKMGLNGEFTGKQHPSGYQSSSQATLNATERDGHWIKAYSVWNFITSFSWKEKEIYFKVNNLFNEQYYSRAYAGSSTGSVIYPAGTYTWVNPGAGREFVIGAKWEFL